MTHICPQAQHFKDNPHPPQRVRWICARARVSKHHASAIAALYFGEVR